MDTKGVEVWLRDSLSWITRLRLNVKQRIADQIWTKIVSALPTSGLKRCQKHSFVFCLKVKWLWSCGCYITSCFKTDKKNTSPFSQGIYWSTVVVVLVSLPFEWKTTPQLFSLFSLVMQHHFQTIWVYLLLRQPSFITGLSDISYLILI